MNIAPRPNRTAIRSLVYLSVVAVLAACGGGGGNGGYAGPPVQQPPAQPPVQPPVVPPPAVPEASAFALSALASNGTIANTVNDPDVINPWGLVIAPDAPAWFVNNATGKATIYDGTGKKANLVVTIPAGTNGASAPTGIVGNASTTDFAVSNGTTSAAARFIFAGEAGTISGWNPTVNPNTAITMHDDGADGAIYKGLAIAGDGTSNFLYATDFHNSKVDVFDNTFTKITTAGAFEDPDLPDGFAPYGIQAVQLEGETVIVVTYAQQDADARDEVTGAGLGLVNTFDIGGNLIANLIPSGGELNAPWGVALAPADFGTLSGALLIANFGDGLIQGFDAATGEHIGPVSDASGEPIQNDGLWAIAFGNGARNQRATTLYFTAGIANQAAGVYGRIDLGETAPDVVAPTVSIAAPAAGQVTATVPISADAADNVGVTQVEFLAGTAVIGTDTAAPFTVDWNSTSVENGNVNLTARARDAFGNVTTSTAVAVIVNNTAPPPVTLADLQTNVFGPRCSGCHSGAGAGLPGSMNLSSAQTTFAALVNVASLEVPALLRVKPGDPDNSFVIHKIEGTQTAGQRMPAGGPFLDQATIDQVRAWITAGASAQ
jgi:uncharacterized protein (TIGR03118 family)